MVHTALGQMIRRAILKDFAMVQNSDEPRRKDMVGLGEYTDLYAATSILKCRTNPIKGPNLQHFQQLAISLLAGSLRAGNRLLAANLADTDQCSCGERHTLKHVLWRQRRRDDVK